MMYRTVERGTPEMLSEIVNTLLNDGWKLQGGISVLALGEDEYLYVQALVLTDSNFKEQG